MICSHLLVLLRYRVTARHTYRNTEVQQNERSGHKLRVNTALPKYRIR